MNEMIQPLLHQWQDPALEESLSSFHSFSKLLGLESLQEYLLSRNAERIEDWSSHPLDDEGQKLQTRIQEAIDVGPYLWEEVPTLLKLNRLYH